MLVLEFLQTPPVDLVNVLTQLGMKSGATAKVFLGTPDVANKLVLLTGVEKWNAYLFRAGLNERWFLLDRTYEGLKIQKSIGWEIIESGPLSQESFFDLSPSGVWMGLINPDDRVVGQASLFRHAPYYGRLKEKERLQHFLELNRCVVVAGGPGSGKRALMQQVLGAIHQQGERRVVTATFSGILPNLIAEISAQVDGLATTQLDRLVEQIGDRDLILAIHRAEADIDAMKNFVELLLGQCPNVSLVVSTRRLMAVSGSAQMVLGGLSRPVVLDEVASNAAFDSVDLFLDRAQFIKPGFTIRPEDRADFIELIRKLGGNPAAIEQVATLVDRFDLGQLAKFSDDAFDRLGQTASQSSLRDAWRPAWERTDPNQRLLLAATTYLRGPFRLSDLVFVLQDLMDEQEVFHAFNELYEWCWFTAFDVDRPENFFEPDPIGMQIAHEQFLQPKQERSIEKRLDEWALQIAQEGETGPIQVLYGDVRHRMNLAAGRGNLDYATEVALLVFEYWYAMGFFVEGMQQADELLKRIGRRKVPFLDRLLLSNLYLHADYDADRSDKKLKGYARQALKIASESGERARMGTAMMGLARLYQKQNWVKSYRWAKRAFNRLEGESNFDRRLYAANLLLPASFHAFGFDHFLEVFRSFPEAVRQDGYVHATVVYLAALAKEVDLAFEFLPSGLIAHLNANDRTNTYRLSNSLAMLFNQKGWHKEAVTILGWRAAILSELEYVNSEETTERSERSIREAREALSADEFSEAWMTGQTMSFEELLRYSFDIVTSKK